MRRCLKCKKELDKRFPRRQYCSTECRGSYRRGKPNPFNIDKGHTVFYYCMECSKPTRVKLATYNKAKNHFCSPRCASTFAGRVHSKENHWNWKGGISKNHRRENTEYKEWRLEVYRRDRFSCTKCGNRENIVAHHIKPYDKFPELRYELTNGLTLCRACHKKVHSEIGMKTRFVPLQVTHKIVVS